MSSTTHRQWLLAARPQGLPQSSDFTWKEGPVPAAGEGELVIRTVYLSLDPTNRVWMAGDSYLPAVKLGETMRGIGIGVVEDSRREGFAAGDIVQGLLGWQSHMVSDGKGLAKLPKLPVPLSAHFGLLGHIGFTAYFGLLDIGQPKEGETLVVSAAAGAVGSLAAQIGKLKGCRVVGIAGSDEKCAWLTGELGLDAAINYRTEPVREALARACPNGIDIYFENVGCKTLEAVLS
jgi:NADPH-dependent curcumin reductase